LTLSGTAFQSPLINSFQHSFSLGGFDTFRDVRVVGLNRVAEQIATVLVESSIYNPVFVGRIKRSVSRYRDFPANLKTTDVLELLRHHRVAVEFTFAAAPY